jgi:hypothetical protein
VRNAKIPCRSHELRPFLSVMYFFPATLLHQLFFHPPSLLLVIYFLVYLSVLLFSNSSIILFLGILFCSILSTCPNQRNPFNLIVSVIVQFLTVASIFYWLISSNFLFHCHVLGLKFFNTLSFQKFSIGSYHSLLVSRFLIHMLTFCLLLCSLVLILTASVVWWLACWPLVPEFAGSNPAEVVGFFRYRKRSSACLPSEGK